MKFHFLEEDNEVYGLLDAIMKLKYGEHLVDHYDMKNERIGKEEW